MLVGMLRDGWYDDLPCGAELADALEDAVISMISRGVASDNLEKISDATEQWRELLDEQTQDAVEGAIRCEFDDVDSIIADIDSESMLDEYSTSLQKLASRAGISHKRVDSVVEKINERIDELQQESAISEPPSRASAAFSEGDVFDDEDLKNLFSSLTAT